LTNGSFVARITDIFSDAGETRLKTSAIQTEYDKALVDKLSKLEGELKELRAQFEDRIIQELPEAKRETAKKLLETSRTKWAEAGERDSKMRGDFLEHMRAAAQAANANRAKGVPSPTQPKPNGVPDEAQTWLRDERAKATIQDSETILGLRALLPPEDATRFDRYNRSRVANLQSTPARPPRPPSESTPAQPGEEAKKSTP